MISGRRSWRALAGWCGLLAALLLLAEPTRAEGPTYVCGQIDAAHNSWALLGSPYIVCSEFGAWSAPGVTLSIGGGVQVQGGGLSGSIRATNGSFSNSGVAGELSLSGCTFSGTLVTVNSGSVSGGQFSGGSSLTAYEGTVENCNITGTGSGTGISLVGSTVTVDRCTIEGFATGVSVLGSATGSVIRNCVIRDNSGYGVKLYPPAGTPEMSANTWSGNGFDVYLYSGSYTHDLTIATETPLRVEMGSGGGTAVSFLGSTLTLQGPVEVTSGLYIVVWNDGRVIAEGVTFHSGGSYALLVGQNTPGEVSLNGCTLDGAGGVYVVHGSATILATLFQNCSTAVLVVGTGTCLCRYDMFENCSSGVMNYSTATVDARWCWWGNPSGPGPVGPGTGARVSANVLYDPWVGVETQLGNTSSSGSSADPVNTAIGNFTHGETDLSIASRGPALAFTRYYNSRDRYAGPLGPGWTHTYNIVFTPGDKVVSAKWSDGRVDYFGEDETGKWLPFDRGIHDRLSHELDGTWTLTKKDLSVYRFDAEGKLLSIADRNDNMQACAYDLDGRLQSVTDPTGRQLTFTYNDDLLTGVTDVAGVRTVTFGYIFNRLDRVTDILGHVTTYKYDSNSFLETITDQRGVRTIFNVYDSRGRVMDQRDGRDNPTYFAYDTPNAGDTRLTDALGNQVVHTHESFLLRKIAYPGGSTLEYTYDGHHNRTSIKDRNGNTVHFLYDDCGNVTRTTAPDGGVTTVVYGDPRFPDLPTRKSDALGVVTEWQYDASGNVLLERRAVGTALETQRAWTYNNWGQVLTETDELGHVATYHYDSTPGREGLLLWVDDAEGHRAWYDYDVLWRRTKVTDARGSALGDAAYTTAYTYDVGDRLTRVVDPICTREYEYDNIGNRTLVRGCNGNERTYEYDENNNLRFAREPLGRTTEYRYDALNRKVRMIDPNGHETTYEYDAMGNLVAVTRLMYGAGPDLETTYTHDKHGNVLMVTDPSLRTVSYTHDAVHRKKSQTNDLGHTWGWDYDYVGRVIGATDAMGYSTAYDYDRLGRLAGVTVWNEAGNPETTMYDYDLTGNLRFITDTGGRMTEKRYNAVGWLVEQVDGLGNSYRYGCDAVGNQTSVLDANGADILMTYDAENRLTRIDYPDTTQVAFTCDANGNRMTMIDSTGTISYEYDALDRLTASTDSFAKRVEYGYDRVGNRTSLKYPGQETPVAYRYDAADRLWTITDWSSRTTTYTSDEAGRIIGIDYPNGVQHMRDYDGCGRLNSMQDERGGATLLRYVWTRDAEGNPISEYSEGTLSPVLSLPPEVTYTYDGDNRLVSSTEGTYGFDDNGNQISRTVNGTTTSFAFDLEDRLIRQTTGTSVVDHVYDGGGYRVARVENGVEARYVLDRGRSMSHVLCETDNAGNITAYYVQGPQIVAQIGTDGSERYYHSNAVSSVVSLTDGSGAVTDRYAYEPFGVPAGREGTTPNPFTYVGGLGVMAEPDGLYFMRARFYDGNVARMLGRDPVAGILMSPQTLHGYIYSLNNPLVYFDPSGEIAFVALAVPAVAGAVVGAASYAILDYAIQGKAWNWNEFAGRTVGGAVAGATLPIVAAAGVGAMGAGAVAFVSGAAAGYAGYLSDIATQQVLDQSEIKNISATDLAISTLTGGAGGYVTRATPVRGGKLPSAGNIIRLKNFNSAGLSRLLRGVRFGGLRVEVSRNVKHLWSDEIGDAIVGEIFEETARVLFASPRKGDFKGFVSLAKHLLPEEVGAWELSAKNVATTSSTTWTTPGPFAPPSTPSGGGW